MVKTRKSISLITSTIMSASIFNFSTFIPVKADSDAVFTNDRIYGADRFETAAKIADKGWTTTSDYAVIATGEDYPDALCASPLAKKYDAPIILTEKNKLSDSAKQELKRLSVEKVFIIGGTGAVSANVESQINDLGIKPTRIAGNNRYETSAKVADYFDKPSTIAIATGNNFADALSFASVAAAYQYPILLTDKDSIDSDIQQYIKNASSTITTSYVIGGTGVVSDSVLNSLKNPIRLSGKNRYETNTAVLKYFIKNLDLSNVYLATGNDFPDALASSVLASKSKTPTLLVDSSVDPSTISFVNDNASSIKNITAIGGTGVISDNLLKNASENFVNYVITFNDTNLQNAIDEALNKKDGEPILKKETDKITTLNLNLSKKYISSLEGIQYLTNLTSLSIETNCITDITPLSNLINITNLDLSFNGITDITPLCNLTNLTDLNLSNNNITDLTPLSKITNLAQLNLLSNKITDLSTLSNLTNLSKLYLSYNDISNLDILSKFTNLTDLYLYNCNITDLTPLKNLTNLTTLYLFSNSITNLTPLSNLTNLTTLDLSGNTIIDLTPLNKLVNLNILSLSYNNITDASSLSKLVKLSILNLYNNPINNIDKLKTALPNCVISN